MVIKKTSQKLLNIHESNNAAGEQGRMLGESSHGLPNFSGRDGSLLRDVSHRSLSRLVSFERDVLWVQKCFLSAIKPNTVANSSWEAIKDCSS